jgi:hypothetical protein
MEVTNSVIPFIPSHAAMHICSQTQNFDVTSKLHMNLVIHILIVSCVSVLVSHIILMVSSSSIGFHLQDPAILKMTCRKQVGKAATLF